MLTLINTSNDPRYNLALEEYVLKHVDLDDDLIFLWVNGPSIIIGRNQNTIEEVNSEYVKEHGIQVVRRTSGGGAVYHDLNNLNFTFMTKSLKDNLNNYRKFTEPVIEALRSLGVPAEFSGRNDIVVEGQKISGNAQTYYKNKMFHHGTILFNADLGMVSKVLTVKPDKIQSKGIKSVRSRVTNIYPYLTEKVTMEEFQDRLLKYLLKTDQIEDKVYTLSEEDLKNIQKLRDEKYDTWEWNYGESPAFDLQKTGRFTGGSLDIRLNVDNGIIKDCKIFGDFFGRKEIDEVAQRLTNQKFEENTLREVLDSIKLEEYVYNITTEDFINCLFN
jgi:lipoate---protein ligase